MNLRTTWLLLAIAGAIVLVLVCRLHGGKSSARRGLPGLRHHQ